MKEYYLIPVGEFNQMDKSKLLSTNKNNIFSNNTLPSNVILDVYNQHVRGERMGNSVAPKSEIFSNGGILNENLENISNGGNLNKNLEKISDERENDESIREINPNQINDFKAIVNASGEKRKNKEEIESSNPKKVKFENQNTNLTSSVIDEYIIKIVPTGYEENALKTVHGLLDKNIISLNRDGDVIVTDSPYRVDLGTFLKMMFIKNSSIKGHEPMFIHLLNHIDLAGIRNQKIISLTRAGSMRRLLTWTFTRRNTKKTSQ